MLKEIEGYENYLVSDTGEVYSKHKNVLRKKRIHSNKQVLYPQVDLWKENVGRKFYVHRLVAQTFIPNPNNLPEVNHIDGNRKNNQVSNLEWVDSLGNKLHAIQTGLRTYHRMMSDQDLENCLNAVLYDDCNLTELAKNPKYYQLPTLSIKLKEYAKKQGKLDIYMQTLKKQRANRNRKVLNIINAKKAQRLS